MKGYKYCVVEYMPNLIAGELVNVGIIIHDMETMRIKGKFTKNSDEIIRRTLSGFTPGVAELIRLSFEDRDFDRTEKDPEHLIKTHKEDKGTYARFFESDIRGGIFNGDSLEKTLDRLYDFFITIDKLKEESKK